MSTVNQWVQGTVSLGGGMHSVTFWVLSYSRRRLVYESGRKYVVILQPRWQDQTEIGLCESSCCAHDRHVHQCCCLADSRPRRCDKLASSFNALDFTVWGITRKRMIHLWVDLSLLPLWKFTVHVAFLRLTWLWHSDFWRHWLCPTVSH